MVKRKHGVIVETPTEARQAEPGPSILIAACRQRKCRDGPMAALWFVFFRT